RGNRTISPWSTITLDEYVQSCVDGNTEGALRSAVSRSPTNWIAFDRLAQKLIALSDGESLRNDVEIGTYTDRAISLAGSEPQPWATKAALLQRQLKCSEALSAIH